MQYFYLEMLNLKLWENIINQMKHIMLLILHLRVCSLKRRNESISNEILLQTSNNIYLILIQVLLFCPMFEIAKTYMKKQEILEKCLKTQKFEHQKIYKNTCSKFSSLYKRNTYTFKIYTCSII